MNKVGLVAGLVVLVCLIFLAYNTTMRYFDAQEEVEKTKQELAQGEAEYAATQAEINTLLENPGQ